MGAGGNEGYGNIILDACYVKAEHGKRISGNAQAEALIEVPKPFGWTPSAGKGAFYKTSPQPALTRQDLSLAVEYVAYIKSPVTCCEPFSTAFPVPAGPS